MNDEPREALIRLLGLLTLVSYGQPVTVKELEIAPTELEIANLRAHVDRMKR
jgi:hypothetical protein